MSEVRRREGEEGHRREVEGGQSEGGRVRPEGGG
jgi:hypothetical protein